MTPEQQQQLLIESNKELYAAVDFSLDVKAFLGSVIGKYLIGNAEDERDEAIKALVNTDPMNVSKIMELQQTIKRAESIQFWMAEAIQAGINADEQLRAQDRAHSDEADQDQ